jgi:lysozyme
MMNPSDELIELIKRAEGFSAQAYPDPGTGGEPYTIGYGHTGHVKLGDVVDEAQADELLRADLQHAVDAVHELVAWPLSQKQFDALVDFVYNVGTGNFTNSTLLKMINQRDFIGAGEQFLRWNKAGGHVMAGLTKRREQERELFLSA